MPARKEGRTGADAAETGVIEATVEGVLPRAMYRVRSSVGRVMRVGVDASSSGTIVKLIVGDRVAIRIAARDPSRGQIVRKL
jgi:translation initiation factor IF-1